MRQATQVTGIRRARYLGLPKTQLEHNIAAAAINMIRMDAYWTGHPWTAQDQPTSPDSTSRSPPDRISQQGHTGRATWASRRLHWLWPARA
jgi:hypothetical protein